MPLDPFHADVARIALAAADGHDVALVGRLDIGPVLHIEDAVANKVGAMIGRNLPRDYVDVAGAAGSTPRAHLLRAAFEHDPGLRVEDVAGAMHQLDRLRSDDFAGYGLDDDAVSRLRATFAGWPRDPEIDEEGRAAHTTAQAR